MREGDGGERKAGNVRGEGEGEAGTGRWGVEAGNGKGGGLRSLFCVDLGGRGIGGGERREKGRRGGKEE